MPHEPCGALKDVHVARTMSVAMEKTKVLPDPNFLVLDHR